MLEDVGVENANELLSKIENARLWAYFHKDWLLPESLSDLANFDRNAWTADHDQGRRRLRGWGWNEPDPLPIIPWTIESGVEVLIDLPATVNEAFAFNRWQDLVESSEGERV